MKIGKMNGNKTKEEKFKTQKADSRAIIKLSYKTKMQ